MMFQRSRWIFCLVFLLSVWEQRLPQEICSSEAAPGSGASVLSWVEQAEKAAVNKPAWNCLCQLWDSKGFCLGSAGVESGEQWLPPSTAQLLLCCSSELSKIELGSWSIRSLAWSCGYLCRLSEWFTTSWYLAYGSLNNVTVTNYCVACPLKFPLSRDFSLSYCLSRRNQKVLTKKTQTLGMASVSL